jgi:hypothetical protein
MALFNTAITLMTIKRLLRAAEVQPLQAVKEKLRSNLKAERLHICLTVNIQQERSGIKI